MRQIAPTILLFDLGGVLVENSIFQDLASLLPEECGLDSLKDRWLSSRSVRDFETGSIGERAFGIRFVEEWALDIAPSEFIRRFEKWPKGPFEGVLELLEELRFHFKLAILSNCNALHWQRMSSLTQRVDYAFSSHEIGIAKPHRAVFEHVCRSMGCDAKQVLFFDDSVTNVEAAREAGLNAVHADGFSAVQERLHAYLT